MVFPQYRLGTVFKDLSIARLYMNDIYSIGWLGMSDFVAFQCNFALSRMWIDGAIKIICLKSVKLLSFAVNSDQNSDTDPNLEATVQYCSCKMYLIYRRSSSVSFKCQFKKSNVAWDGVSVMKSLNQFLLLFWRQNQQFLLTFCLKVVFNG